MDSFTDKLAVVTGGGSGMGRELVRQLAAQGCSVAACDVNAGTVAETAALARADAPPGVQVTSHACDVSDEEQVLRFRDELLEQHASDHVDLVFSNAGIGGGSSFATDLREHWERAFATDWWGVYYCARAFLPLLIASGDGVLVNTSSVNGFWATTGPGMPNNAYSTAKFAVRGFSEALIEDLRSNAPQVRVAVVMPGHVGTDILANTFRAHGVLPEKEHLTDDELAAYRARLISNGMPEDGSAEETRQALLQANADFRDKAPASAAQAATIILDGVRSGAWRILVGEDAKMIDTMVRANPEAAYDYDELAKMAKDKMAGAWSQIADPAARLRAGLTDLCRSYRAGAGMLTHIYRDFAALPEAHQQALRDGDTYFRDILTAALSGAGDEHRLRAVIGHATSFWTWHSLCLDQGLSDTEAVDAMTGMVLAITPVPQADPAR